jgi:hypothetical protein
VDLREKEQKRGGRNESIGRKEEHTRQNADCVTLSFFLSNHHHGSNIYIQKNSMEEEE